MFSFLRRSGFAIALGVLAWTAGCATVKPAIEPAFAARTYTPIRIALLPPDVFVVLDEVGDNDPAKSEALRRTVFDEVVKFSTAAFRQRGYDLDLSARWDGIVGQDGQVLVSRDELAWMANGILQYANGPAGAKQGPLTTPEIIAPELAAKIGWAAQSDALLYVNLKGITVSNGKRAAEVFGVVFFVAIVALIVLALVADSKHGGGGGGGGRGLPGGGGRSGSPVRGTPPVGAARTPGVGAPIPGPRGMAPFGRGSRLPPAGPGRVYGGGPHIGLGVGIFVPVPLGGPTYTHDGEVTHEDEWFAGDQLYVSMTLVNASDGRVLWHFRNDLDFDVQDPNDVQDLVNRLVGAIPMRGDLVDQSSKH